MCDGSPVRAEAAAFGLVIARLRGDLDTASALVNAELPRARPRPAAEGKLRVQLVALAALGEQATETMDQARRAVELLGGQRPALAAAARSLSAWGALYAGEPATARDQARDAARLLDTVSDVTLRPHVGLLGPLAWVETRLGDLAAAAEHLDRAHAVVAQAGHSSALPYLLVVHAALRTRLGRLDSALRLAERAALLADQMGSLEMRAMADAVRVAPLLWTEGPTAALAAAGRLADDVRPGLDFLTDTGIPWPADPTTEVARQVALAQALARVDAVDAAWRAAERAEENALGAGLDYELGSARYAKAFVAARAGRLDQSASLAEPAATRLAASVWESTTGASRNSAGPRPPTWPATPSGWRPQWMSSGGGTPDGPPVSAR